MSTSEPDLSAHEPGLELHEWETLWQQLQEAAADDPAGALPELADFAEEGLRRRGLRPEEEAVENGEAAEVVASYRFAREVSDRVESGESVGPGDIGAAHEALRELYAWLT